MKLDPAPTTTTDITQPAWQTWFNKVFILLTYQGSLTVANLPAVGVAGWTAYASNGRKVGETAGNGTGVPVYFSNGAWRVYSTDAAVTA